jgi:multiple sugar transport system permease protein
MFPPIATVSPLYLILRATGLRDTLVGLVPPYATFALPLTLWILTSFFRQLPDELYRAARVDGCTPLGAFWRVLLPLAAPGLATTAILVFIFAWNEFLYALTFLSSPEKRTVPVAISLFASEHKEPWGEIAAASVIATMPLVVMTVLFQRRIVSGLTAGAVKE